MSDLSCMHIQPTPPEINGPDGLVVRFSLWVATLKQWSIRPARGPRFKPEFGPILFPTFLPFSSSFNCYFFQFQLQLFVIFFKSSFERRRRREREIMYSFFFFWLLKSAATCNLCLLLIALSPFLSLFFSDFDVNFTLVQFIWLIESCAFCCFFLFWDVLPTEMTLLKTSANLAIIQSIIHNLSNSTSSRQSWSTISFSISYNFLLLTSNIAAH